jgi:gamma-glutamyltranspeptidase / glutathione hydrolase
VTLNLLDHGMTIQQAVDAPRISATGKTGFNVDVGNPSSPTPFPPESITGLTTLGHTFGNTVDIGSVQAVVVDAQTGTQYGGADARREGTVIGLPRPQRK